MLIQKSKIDLIASAFKDESQKWLDSATRDMAPEAKAKFNSQRCKEMNKCITKMWLINTQLPTFSEDSDYEKLIADLSNFLKKCTLFSFKFFILESIKMIIEILDLQVTPPSILSTQEDFSEDGYDTERLTP